MKENQVPGIRKIGSLQVHTSHLTFSLKKTDFMKQNLWKITCSSYYIKKIFEEIYEFIRFNNKDRLKKAIIRGVHPHSCIAMVNACSITVNCTPTENEIHCRVARFF